MNTAVFFDVFAFRIGSARGDRTGFAIGGHDFFCCPMLFRNRRNYELENHQMVPFTIPAGEVRGAALGRGCGVGRGLGVGPHLPVHGVGVGVGVGVAVGLGVTVGVGVGPSAQQGIMATPSGSRTALVKVLTKFPVTASNWLTRGGLVSFSGAINSVSSEETVSVLPKDPVEVEETLLIVKKGV